MLAALLRAIHAKGGLQSVVGRKTFSPRGEVRRNLPRGKLFLPRKPLNARVAFMSSRVVKVESARVGGTKLENRVEMKAKVTPTLISLLEATRGDEVTTTCTHDTDVSHRPSSVLASHVDGNPRRSLRTRRVSTKFDPSDFDSVVDIKPKAGPSKKFDGPVTERGKNVKCQNPNRPRQSELELVSPRYLISLLDNFNNITFSAGRYGVRMPIGPEEYVIVDGVDYLRSLGYSDAEVKDDDETIKEKIKEEFIEEVLYEPQRALKEERDSDEKDRIKEEIAYNDVIHEISSVDSSDDPQHAIAILGSTSLAQSLDDSSNSDVDIEGVEQATFFASAHLRKKPASKKRRKQVMYARTALHNEMERQRRNEMANRFSELLDIINKEKSDGNAIKLPKVKILARAVDLVGKMKIEQLHLEAQRNSLLHTKMKLMEEQAKLQTLALNKNKQPPTRAKQPMKKKAKR